MSKDKAAQDEFGALKQSGNKVWPWAAKVAQNDKDYGRNNPKNPNNKKNGK